MQDKVFYCADTAQRMKDKVKAWFEQFADFKEAPPTLAVIQVGDNPASSTYVRNKEKACEYVGIKSEKYHLPELINEEVVLKLINTLNEDDNVHGILVQLPLPKHMDEHKIIKAIASHKDVDGFHIENVGSLSTGLKCIKPCTPYGVIQILKDMKVDIKGKHCVILGRSNIVGKPMAQLMLQEDATVTICHSKTKDLEHHIAQADILICAIGKAKFINNPEVIKRGAVIIDVGINRDENGKLCGDVEITDELLEKVSFITPVPKGVGVMTVAMLMYNVMVAYDMQRNR